VEVPSAEIVAGSRLAAGSGVVPRRLFFACRVFRGGRQGGVPAVAAAGGDEVFADFAGVFRCDSGRRASGRAALLLVLLPARRIAGHRRADRSARQLRPFPL